MDAVIENFSKGWVNAQEPFVIPRDSFYELWNCYVDHGRVEKRKGFTIVGYPSRFISLSALTSFTTGTDILIGALAFTDIPTGIINNIIPTSVYILTTVSSIVLVDNGRGMLTRMGSDTAVGTVNYMTGSFTVSDSDIVSASSPQYRYRYRYRTFLPATGIVPVSDTKTLYFDTRNSYSLPTSRTPLESSLPFVEGAMNLDSSYLNGNALVVLPAHHICNLTGNYTNQITSTRFGRRATFITNGLPGRPFFPVQSWGANSVSIVVSLITSDPPIVGDIVQLVGLPGTTDGSSVPGTYRVQSVAVNTTVYTLTLENFSSNAAIIAARGAYVHFLTRDVTGTGIKVYNGRGFINYAPILRVNPLTLTNNVITYVRNVYLLGADIIISFGGRLLFIGTYEGMADPAFGTDYFPLKIRYTGADQVFYFTDIELLSGVMGIPVIGFEGNANVIRTGTNGLGGFLNIATGGRAIWAEVINGRLLIGLERGVVELNINPTGTIPFSLRYFDSPLGSNAKNGHVHLDKFIMSIGNNGIISSKPRASLLSSLFEIERLDRDIVDEYQNISAVSGRERLTHATRDTFDEVAYFNFISNGFTYHNRAIAYNYRNKTYALFRERFTISGITRVFFTNFVATDDSRYNVLLRVSGKPISIGGTAQGLFLARGIKQVSDPDIIITDIDPAVPSAGMSRVTAPLHTLEVGEYVYINDTSLVTSFIGGSNIHRVTAVTTNTFDIDGVYNNPVYTGSAVCMLINNFRIRTAAFKPFWQQGKRLQAEFTFLMETANNNIGFTVNKYVSFNKNTSVSTSNINYAFKGNEKNTAPIRFFRDISSIQGDDVQVEITLSDDQIRDFNYNNSQHILHAIRLYVLPAGTLQ